MNKLINLHAIVIIGILLIFNCNAAFTQQKQHRHKNTQGFTDIDGDGYNDNAPDHDGDGIPNGLDPDWIKGNGRRMNYIDANGDGINDLIQINKQTDQERQKNHKKDKSNNK